MKRALVFVGILSLAISANSQKVLTGKEIYRINRDAVVLIYVANNFSGNGFIVSSDGLIVTANHVIATRESSFRSYAADIKVVVNGKPPYSATPMIADISDDQVNYDSAILKIDGSKLPHVTLGSWDEVDTGDNLTMITSYPGMGFMLLQGIVSSKASFLTPLGPKPVNTLVFQAPIRNGFSGSPVFSQAGNVVGIEDTKVFGISPALNDLRTKWDATHGQGSVSMFGIDIAGSFTELINNLDLNLISGLGSSVDIAYAKEQEKARNKPK